MWMFPRGGYLVNDSTHDDGIWYATRGSVRCVLAGVNKFSGRFGSSPAHAATATARGCDVVVYNDGVFVRRCPDLEQWWNGVSVSHWGLRGGRPWLQSSLLLSQDAGIAYCQTIEYFFNW